MKQTLILLLTFAFLFNSCDSNFTNKSNSDGNETPTIAPENNPACSKKLGHNDIEICRDNTHMVHVVDPHISLTKEEGSNSVKGVFSMTTSCYGWRHHNDDHRVRYKAVIKDSKGGVLDYMELAVYYPCKRTDYTPDPVIKMFEGKSFCDNAVKIDITYDEGHWDLCSPNIKPCPH